MTHSACGRQFDSPALDPGFYDHVGMSGGALDGHIHYFAKITEMTNHFQVDGSI